MSRVAYIFMVSSIFVVLGILLPILNTAFYGNSGDSDTNLESVWSTLETPPGGFDNIITGAVNIGKLFLSVLSMFFWSFGTIPWYIDTFLLLLRIPLWYIIVDTIWPG